MDKKLWPFGEDLRKRFEQTRVRPDLELFLCFQQCSQHAVSIGRALHTLDGEAASMSVRRAEALNPAAWCALLAQSLLLRVMQHKQLLESNDDTILLQKIQLRAPYVTPLNVLQVYCLKALRAIESGQGIDPRYKARALWPS